MFRSSIPDAIDPLIADHPTRSNVSVSEKVTVSESFAQIDFEIVGHKLSYSNVESDSVILSVALPPAPACSDVILPNSPPSPSISENSRIGSLSPNLSVRVGDLSGSILDDLPSTPSDIGSLASVVDAPTTDQHSPIIVKTVTDWDVKSAPVCDQRPPVEVVFQSNLNESVYLDADKEYPLVDSPLYQIFVKDQAIPPDQTKMMAISLDSPVAFCAHPRVPEPFAQSIVSGKVKFVCFIMMAFSVATMVGCAFLTVWNPDIVVTMQHQHSAPSSLVAPNETLFYEQVTSSGILSVARRPEPIDKVVDSTTDDEAKHMPTAEVSANIYTPAISGDPASMDVNSKIGVPGMTLNHLASFFASGATDRAERFAGSQIGKALHIGIEETKTGRQTLQRFNELYRFRDSVRACFETAWSWTQRVFWCFVAVVVIFVASRVLFWVAPMDPLDAAFQLEESEAAVHGTKRMQDAIPKVECPSILPIVKGNTNQSPAGTKCPSKPQRVGAVKSANSIASTSQLGCSRCESVNKADDFSEFLRSCKRRLSHKGRPSRADAIGCREQLGYDILAYESLTKEDLMHIAKHFGLGVVASTANKATLITRVVTAYESMLEGYTTPQLKKVLAVKGIQPVPNTRKNVLVKLAVEAAF